LGRWTQISLNIIYPGVPGLEGHVPRVGADNRVAWYIPPRRRCSPSPNSRDQRSALHAPWRALAVLMSPLPTSQRTPWRSRGHLAVGLSVLARLALFHWTSLPAILENRAELTTPMTGIEHRQLSCYAHFATTADVVLSFVLVAPPTCSPRRSFLAQARLESLRRQRIPPCESISSIFSGCWRS
jgi:hypothetical protein